MFIQKLVIIKTYNFTIKQFIEKERERMCRKSLYFYFYLIFQYTPQGSSITPPLPESLRSTRHQNESRRQKRQQTQEDIRFR